LAAGEISPGGIGRPGSFLIKARFLFAVDLLTVITVKALFFN
jgi:hypothetical protein